MNIIKRIERARSLSTAFMYHSDNCQWQAKNETKCDCGYFQVLISVKVDFNEILCYTKNLQSSSNNLKIQKGK